jgi:hydrogenase small subunit
MEITRRDFLKYSAGAAVMLGLTSLQLSQVEKVFAGSSNAPVIWLSGSACTGCSVSLMNAVNPTIDSVLINTINLKYHPNIMAAAGDMAVAEARSTAQAGGFVLIVEGAIPTGSAGKYCYVWEENGKPVTMAEAVTSLAAKAKYLVAVGTCASFGGIPAVNATTGSKGLGAFLGRSVINLPGCPAHPDWIIGSLVKVLSGAMPALDLNNRPLDFYTKQSMHDRCPRREGEEANRFGQDGRCLQELGCQGKKAHADCDRRLWNNKQNYCIGVNGLCTACTEPSFPAFPLHRNDD